MLYFVIAEPPLLAGADHDNDTNPFPAVAESPDGAPGTLAAGLAETSLDFVPSPTLLTALTL